MPTPSDHGAYPEAGLERPPTPYSTSFTVQQEAAAKELLLEAVRARWTLHHSPPSEDLLPPSPSLDPASPLSCDTCPDHESPDSLYGPPTPSAGGAAGSPASCSCGRDYVVASPAGSCAATAPTPAEMLSPPVPRRWTRASDPGTPSAPMVGDAGPGPATADTPPAPPDSSSVPSSPNEPLHLVAPTPAAARWTDDGTSWGEMVQEGERPRVVFSTLEEMRAYWLRFVDPDERVWQGWCDEAECEALEKLYGCVRLFMGQDPGAVRTATAAVAAAAAAGGSEDGEMIFEEDPFLNVSQAYYDRFLLEVFLERENAGPRNLPRDIEYVATDEPPPRVFAFAGEERAIRVNMLRRLLPVIMKGETLPAIHRMREMDEIDRELELAKAGAQEARAARLEGDAHCAALLRNASDVDPVTGQIYPPRPAAAPAAVPAAADANAGPSISLFQTPDEGIDATLLSFLDADPSLAPWLPALNPSEGSSSSAEARAATALLLLQQAQQQQAQQRARQLTTTTTTTSHNDADETEGEAATTSNHTPIGQAIIAMDATALGFPAPPDPRTYQATYPEDVVMDMNMDGAGIHTAYPHIPTDWSRLEAQLVAEGGNAVAGGVDWLATPTDGNIGRVFPPGAPRGEERG